MRDKATRIANAKQAILNLERAIEDLKAEDAPTERYETILASERAKLAKLEGK